MIKLREEEALRAILTDKDKLSKKHAYEAKQVFEECSQWKKYKDSAKVRALRKTIDKSKKSTYICSKNDKNQKEAEKRADTQLKDAEKQRQR